MTFFKDMCGKKPSILIALGGNALNVDESKLEISPQEDFLVAKHAIEKVVELISHGYDRIVITHGNGPQVGRIFLQQELTKKDFPRQTTLDVCVADTQGRIGYIIQNVFDNICRERGVNKRAYSVVGQVVVDPEDPAFENPTKPIGAFYSDEDAEMLSKKYGWVMKSQAKKGMRRVVPSPVPLDVVEKDLIKLMLENGMVAVACGGGGIPVIRNEDGSLEGVEAVIDKDRTSALLANEIGSEVFIILTETDYVYVDYNTLNERPLKKVTLKELIAYQEAGHFPAGSMGPKVEAVINFIRGGGKKAIIANLFELWPALEGKSGTHIIPD